MDISVSLPSVVDKVDKCDPFTSIELAIPEVEGDDSPSVVKRERGPGGEKLLLIPTLQFIEIDDF
jgi:hypothetical protein